MELSIKLSSIVAITTGSEFVKGCWIEAQAAAARAGPKIFSALGELIKLCPFNYLNVFLLAFFIAKNSFIIKVI